MNAKYFIPLLIPAMILVSCKKELMPQDSSSTPLDSPAVAATPTAPGAPATPTQVQPQMQTQQGQQMPVTPSAPPPLQKVAKGMNPPHGQPGHRCDIAVGAPLNSPPGKPGAATVQQINTSQPAMAKPNTTPVVTAPGMNPPHGQEGHRCDIAVGAPLSSPKASPSTPAVLTPGATPAAPVTTQQ